MKKKQTIGIIIGIVSAVVLIVGLFIGRVYLSSKECDQTIVPGVKSTIKVDCR